MRICLQHCNTLLSLHILTKKGKKYIYKTVFVVLFSHTSSITYWHMFTVVYSFFWYFVSLYSENYIYLWSKNWNILPIFYPTKPLPYTHANNICIAIQMFNSLVPLSIQTITLTKQKKKSLTGFKWILTAVQPVFISAYIFTLNTI